MEPYYNKDSDFILHNGDCVEVMNGLDKCTVDLIFADPPYFLSSGRTVCCNGNEKTIYKGG